MIVDANSQFQLIAFTPYTEFIDGFGTAEEVADLLIEEAITQVIKANAALTVHIAGRIYPLKLPPVPSYPAMTYEVMDARHVEHLDDGGGEGEIRGSSGLAQTRFRFKTLAKGIDNFGQAVIIDNLLRLCLQGLRKTVINVIVTPLAQIEIQGISAKTNYSDWNDKTQTHVVISEFEIWAEEKQPLNGG